MSSPAGRPMGKDCADQQRPLRPQGITQVRSQLQARMDPTRFCAGKAAKEPVLFSGVDVPLLQVLVLKCGIVT